VGGAKITDGKELIPFAVSVVGLLYNILGTLLRIS